jgi:hypothetical protein
MRPGVSHMQLHALMIRPQNDRPIEFDQVGAGTLVDLNTLYSQRAGTRPGATAILTHSSLTPVEGLPDSDTS